MDQKALLDFLVLARNFTHQFESLVPLYIIAAGPIPEGLAQRSAMNLLGEAERARLFKEEIDEIILRAQRDGILTLRRRDNRT